MSLLIKGNVKVGNEVFLFNLPPRLTCTPTKWCLEGRKGKPMCYALRNNFRLPSVIKSLKKRYNATKQKGFVAKMVLEIQKAAPEYFRFHSSGDFYSMKYVEKIIEIVRECPETLFRTTTRRRDLTRTIRELNSLPNCIVRESLDDERPQPKMGLNFVIPARLCKNKNVFFCEDDCEECNYYCWEHRVNTKGREL